jgi:hypothetical protein
MSIDCQEHPMRAKGITYDTGFTPGGKSSRPVFEAEAVRREIRVIADDLHCDAVRITGGDPQRLAVAAGHAADAGLEVWFSPFPCELPATELLPYFADCADHAQDVGAEVFVTGCELSLFTPGFFPGDNSLARIDTWCAASMRHWPRSPRCPPSWTRCSPTPRRRCANGSAARSPTPPEYGNRSIGRPSTS